MSTGYKAVVFLGKEFNNEEEAKDFLYHRGIFDNIAFEEIDNIGLCYYLEDRVGFSATPLNYFSGKGFVFGIEINASPNVHYLTDNISHAFHLWKLTFPDIEPQFLKRVVVY
jgi:hypothetical protein